MSRLLTTTPLTTQTIWCGLHGAYQVPTEIAGSASCRKCNPDVEAVEVSPLQTGFVGPCPSHVPAEEDDPPEMPFDPPDTGSVLDLSVALDGVRSFSTGATRSSEQGRYDPEGFLSPIVIERFCEYMHKHRQLPDGSLRASDNWQRGMPRETYLKGMWRHFLHLWTRHRGFEVRDYKAAGNIEEDLCALMFNVQGYLFEVLKSKEVKSND